MRDSPAADAPPPDSFLTPFIIGVTGHMKLPREKTEALREKLRVFFRWLQAEEEESFDGLGPGLGLKDTPVVLLSSMAPGVDQIAAGVAREAEFRFRVVSPLPFPPEQYLRSTTFTSASDAEKAALTSLPHESFYVELADEAALSPEEAARRREVCLTGDAEKPRRYAHLRASGEYVAAYCDLLLAVTDLTGAIDPVEPPAFDPSHAYECGAVTIIRVRRHGITPGLLPVQPALPWADAGPVVYLPWQKTGRVAPATEGVFSFYSDPGSTHVADQAEREVLRETADLVSRFNETAPSADLAKAAGQEMRTMLALGGDAPLPDMPAVLRDRLLRIAGARFRAKKRNYRAGDDVDAWRSRFLTAGVVAVVLLQMHDHWVPSAAPEWVGTLRVGAYLAALAFAVGSLFSLYRFRSGRSEQDQIDARCIAEGLRAQFYWTAAGTGVSAASNYLLRQRGAIRWIVNALSSASFPYEQARSAFQLMPLAARCALLRRVVEGWLLAPGKKGQIGYFHGQLQTIAVERTRYRLQGTAFLAAGVLLSMLLFGLECSAGTGWEGTISGSSLIRFSFALAAVGGLGALGRWISRWEPSRTGAILSPDDNSVIGQELQVRQEAPQAVRRTLASLALMAGALGLGVVVAGLVVLLALGLGDQAGCLPAATECLSMGKSILFALSARSFLSSALRFHTENERNYSAMLSLFESGARRLKAHLGVLEARCRALSPDATTDPQAELAIAAIQDLLLALGREALSEHAEWLHLHRDRPVSPNLPNP
ncbi:MAG: hypothetical protein R3F13_14290 [Prosthecobacter sp.]